VDTDTPPNMEVVTKMGVPLGLALSIAYDARKAGDIIAEAKGEAMAHGIFTTVLALYGHRTAHLATELGKTCHNSELQARKQGRGEWINRFDLVDRPAWMTEEGMVPWPIE